MNSFKLGQISAIELVFALFLMMGLFMLLSPKPTEVSSDYKYQLNSFMDAYITNPDFRNLTMDEDLSAPVDVSKWIAVEELLDKSFEDYEFVIENDAYRKVIFSCDSSLRNKIVAERFFYMKNIDLTIDFYDFRKVSLGVCY